MFRKCTKKSGCKRFKALIQKRLDGAISPEDNLDLDEHLADCPECLEELMAHAVVRDFLGDAKDNPEQVPDGFFESLARRLTDITPARGWQALLGSPFFTTYRNIALAATSVLLVAVLTFSVGTGAFDRLESKDTGSMGTLDSKALIYTNNGDMIVFSGDEGDPDRYTAALDDLERAYEETRGQQADENSEGYIHTSWHGGESASPVK